jgi:hypothetical protein
MSQQFHAWSHMKKSELHPAVVALQVGGGSAVLRLGGLARASCAPLRRRLAGLGLCGCRNCCRGCWRGGRGELRPGALTLQVWRCRARPPAAAAVLGASGLWRWAAADPPPHRPHPLPQEAGLLIGRKAHGAHHRAPFEGNYCIVSGWWNDTLDGSQFFRWGLPGPPWASPGLWGWGRGCGWRANAAGGLRCGALRPAARCWLPGAPGCFNGLWRPAL